MSIINNYVKKIEIVKDGYKKVTQWYRQQKDADQNRFYLFKQFLSNKNNNQILELGCGSGFPSAVEVLKYGGSSKEYIGVDLSEEQIELARKQYPQYSKCFINKEMIQFCQDTDNDRFSGIFSFFSIRHVPRELHAMLYTEIFRILKPGGLLLIDCTEKPHDGTDTWSNNNEAMFWSGFSKEWTLQTLYDLEFNLLDSLYDEKEFAGGTERTLFLLLQK